MRLDLPSFLIGAAFGAGAVALFPRLRPLLLELGTSAIKLGDAAALRFARGREHLEDLVAEARLRARGRGVPRDEGRAEA